MRITIPDDLAEHYQTLLPAKPIEEIIILQLRRFAAVFPLERIIMIRGDFRQRIEQAFGNGNSITSSQELLDAIHKLHRVSMGNVPIEFTNAQLREIDRRARKEHITTPEMVQRIAQESLKLMLESV